MKKRLFALIMASMMVMGAMTGCGWGNEPAPTPTEGEETQGDAEQGGTDVDMSNVEIGVCIYKFDDTFMTGVRNNMEAQANSLGAGIELVDSQNKQATQNDQVDTFITKGMTALPVNHVKRTADRTNG